MAVGGIVAIFLDNSIAGTATERGLTAWEEAAEEDADFTSAYERFRIKRSSINNSVTRGADAGCPRERTAEMPLRPNYSRPGLLELHQVLGVERLALLELLIDLLGLFLLFLALLGALVLRSFSSSLSSSRRRF